MTRTKWIFWLITAAVAASVSLWLIRSGGNSPDENGVVEAVSTQVTVDGSASESITKKRLQAFTPEWHIIYNDILSGARKRMADGDPNAAGSVRDALVELGVEHLSAQQQLTLTEHLDNNDFVGSAIYDLLRGAFSSRATISDVDLLINRYNATKNPIILGLMDLMEDRNDLDLDEFFREKFLQAGGYDDALKQQIAEMLGRVAGADSTRIIFDSLESTDNASREVAALSLRTITNEKVFPALEEVLSNSGSSRVQRTAAVEVMGQIHSERSVRALVNLAVSGDEELATQAEAKLERFTKVVGNEDMRSVAENELRRIGVDPSSYLK